MPGDGGTTGRQLVFWLALVAAVGAAVVLVIEGPPGSGYGWGSVVVSCVLVAVPLVALGLMVRTGERRFAWATVVVAVLVVVFALSALFGNWSGQSSINHALDVTSTLLMLAVCLGALVVTVPLLRRPAP